jgi:flagellar biosynthesis protein FlhA
MNPTFNDLQEPRSAFARRSDTLVAVFLLAVIVVLVVPLPPVLLDAFLAVSLSSSILLLLVTLNARQPLEVSIFPSLLLLLTLFRLSLNVATTRLILLDGDAGKMVSAFGGFVVGGNLAVGVVIFLILVIIQFVVITKGASRISEVNARFVLDAMPGKQMAIDSELNSGSIDEKTARARRLTLTREAEFFGGMDGAGKFVRGDAVAGLVITVVNIIGGIVTGTMKGMSLGEAADLYTRLTIGDGLITQIPALVIATAAGILVTKASSGTSIGHEVGTQMLSRKQPLFVGGVIMCLVGVVPGLPTIPFLAIGGVLIAISRRLVDAPLEEKGLPAAESGAPPSPPETPGPEPFVNTDRVRLEIGSAIIPLTGLSGSHSLPERIASMKRDISTKYGIWIPTVRLRDNLMLEPATYRVLINGRETGKGEIQPGNFMAIDSGIVTMAISGTDTIEPAFGLKAKWIPASSRQRAELAGYTVVDAVTVLVTHLGELLRRHAHELLSREDMQKMLNQLRETSPTIVDELKPDVIRPAALRRVLTNLLAERVPVAGLELILESVVHHGSAFKDPDLLTEKVREDIGHAVCNRFRTDKGLVRVIVFDPNLEARLRNSMHEGRMALSAHVLERLVDRLRRIWESNTLAGNDVAVLIEGGLRRHLRKAVERSIPDLACIAYNEIPNELMIDPVAILHAGEIWPETAAASSVSDHSALTRQDAELARNVA